MHHPSVLVTFDSMRRANSGYFTFGKGLGDELIRQGKDSFDLTYYLFKSTAYQFNGKVDILYLNRVHRLFMADRNKFDLVHFTDQTCRLRPRSVNAKKILTIHDINKVHKQKARPSRVRAYLKKLGKYIKQCDRVVAISNFVAQDIVKYFPDAAGKVSVIYNGADKLHVPVGHQPAYVPQKPFLFTIGELAPHKRFHVLPALLHNNDYELIIAGNETDYKDIILAEADKYNCRDRVIIIGPISEADKAWYYKHCQAFLFPSIAEGFGLPVIEAMHFGKPVFLSKYTSLPEVGGDKAWYFDSFEPAHMQAVFANGLKEYAAGQLAGKIKAHAEQFTWQKAAAEYLKLYEECLNE